MKAQLTYEELQVKIQHLAKCIAYLYIACSREVSVANASCRGWTCLMCSSTRLWKPRMPPLPKLYKKSGKRRKGIVLPALRSRNTLNIICIYGTPKVLADKISPRCESCQSWHYWQGCQRILHRTPAWIWADVWNAHHEGKRRIKYLFSDFSPGSCAYSGAWRWTFR